MSRSAASVREEESGRSEKDNEKGDEMTLFTITVDLRIRQSRHERQVLSFSTKSVNLSSLGKIFHHPSTFVTAYSIQEEPQLSQRERQRY